VLHSWSLQQFDYSAGPAVGYKVLDNAWLSVGYNFTGFTDRDFSAADYTAQGAYLKFRVKFDQESVRAALARF
jgi:opacity protein-like surface antigen